MSVFFRNFVALLSIEMAHLYQCILLAFCVLSSCVLRAQGDGKTLLEMQGDGNGVYHLSFSMGAVTLTNEGDGLVKMHVDGMVEQAPREGLPALPQISRLLVLPRGSSLQVERWQAGDGRQILLEDHRLLSPWQGASVKDAPPLSVEPDKGVYATDAFVHTSNPVGVENLGVMGDRQVFRVTVCPANYNPVTGELLLTSSITATLTSTLSSHNNYSPALHGRYLVVSRPEFRDGLQPFVRWKRQEGYDVIERYADTNQRDHVKDLIAETFDSRYPDRWPCYLLLVGDAAQIQSFPGAIHLSGMEYHATDLYYAEHTGDFLPDVLMGRWPVNDTAELGAVVRKTVRYEQGMGLDTLQLQRLMLVAGDEDEQPAPITTNGQVNYLKREVYRYFPEMDTVCFYNPTSSNQMTDILQAMRQGAAMLNYTAHCSVAGWSSPSLGFSSVDTLDNRQPMLWVNNCCKSNTFSGTGFGEQLLRKADGGAVGVIGATNSTLWNEDFYWAVGPKTPFGIAPAYDSTRPGAFDRLWSESLSAGELTMAGNLAVAAFGSPFDNYYWEIYCLLGDPSLHPWMGVPKELELHSINGVHDGDASLHFSGTPGAIVTAVQGDSLLGVGIVGSDGMLVLDLNRCLDTSDLLVTATSVGHRPLIDTFEVETVVGVAAALREVVVNDSVVHCRVENNGTTPFHGLRLMLSQFDADSVVDALVAEQQLVIDTLLPYHSRQCTLPIQVTAVGQLPEWRAQLFVWDSTEGMLCRLTLRHDMDVNYPEISFRLLENDAVPLLQPNRNYLLEAIIEGMPDSTSLVVTALPSGDTLVNAACQLPATNCQLFTPDTLTHLHIESLLQTGNHRTAGDLFFVGGHRTDSFEEGFSSYPWVQGANPWVIDSMVSYHGGFSARSGAVVNEQTSDLTIEVWMPQPDTLSFMVRTSCEVQYDKFQFTVDGRLWGYELWGESQWERREYVLPAGRHILRWRYVKDVSGSAGSDCAWIDDVRLPLAFWNSAYGWFGDMSSLGVRLTSSPSTKMQLYPNPTTGVVTIEGSGWLRVTDRYGREVFHTMLQPAATTLHFDALPDGLYFLCLFNSGSTTTQKLIIKH